MSDPTIAAGPARPAGQAASDTSQPRSRAGAQAPGPATSPVNEQKLRAAAEKFEGMAIASLLQPMFDTVKSSGGFGGGAGEEQWKPMMVDEIGKAIAKGGGLGLADPIYRAMLQAQEGKR